MDDRKENVNPNPREKANLFSIIFFTYTYDSFIKGYKKHLSENDLYNPLDSDRSKILGDRLETNWNEHLRARNRQKKPPNLILVLLKTFWIEFFNTGVMVIFTELIMRLAEPICLGYLLEYFNADSMVTKNEALYYACGIIVVNTGRAILGSQYYVYASCNGMKTRVACCTLVYRKILKMSRTTLENTTSGKIVNLLSNDVSRFDSAVTVLHYIWVTPTVGMCVTYLLYKNAGAAGLIGVVTVIILVAFQSYAGKVAANFRKKTAVKTDERIRLMDEIISGIQVIKMYAWEKPFSKLVQNCRDKELGYINKAGHLRGLFMTLQMFNPAFALFCTLTIMSLTGQDITAAKVYVFTIYHSILNVLASVMFVLAITVGAELMVTVKRLESFLMEEEFENSSVRNNDKELIVMRNLSVKWRPPDEVVSQFDDYDEKNELLNSNALYRDDKTPLLKTVLDDNILSRLDVTHKKKMKGTLTEYFDNNESSTGSTDSDALNGIDLTVEKRQFLGVIGPVGSGKSTLLLTILGELFVSSGSFGINGTISYAPQEPWIFSATIRQNILFGMEFNKRRYSHVVKVCSLLKDFDQLQEGDMTLVGERGTSLSGGQKARVNLARAIYREADIYLLDDPLSAVDVHVSKHLYRECIDGFLSNKCRILVTNNVHYLKFADNIVILNNGMIENQGKFDELARSGSTFAELLTQDSDLCGDKQRDKEKMKKKYSYRSRTSLARSSGSELSLTDSLLTDDDFESGEEDLEESSEDNVKPKAVGSAFFNYVRAGGNCCSISFLLFLYVIARVLLSLVDLFVSYWTAVEEFSDNKHQTYFETKFGNWFPPCEKNICLYIYGSLVFATLILTGMRSYYHFKMAKSCSETFHDRLFANVIKTNMRFFNVNTSGRILNRFSRDMGGVDETLPKVILDTYQILFIILAAIVVVTVINPYFIIMVAILGTLFMTFRSVFVESSKNIKHLESRMMGPVYTHLNATVLGLTTIRALGAQDILTNEYHTHQDNHTSAWFVFITANAAFGFFLDFLCCIFTGVVTISFLTFGEDINLTGSEVGLAITQAMALTGIVQWGARQSVDMSNMLVTVERILKYNDLPKETQPAIPTQPPTNWPNKGQIVLEDVCLKYDQDLPFILKNLNVTIKSKEKVGIVGRTGAGKSSLIAAFFRLACIEGNIIIDDINTKDLELQVLRSKISIIPQDPVLFSGTLRYNLDPFEEYDDHILYNAIHEVELHESSNGHSELSSHVSDRGSNYSVGQRQLICLARAIVRKNKILLLDEATANVDPQTDDAIQKAIKRKFADCTVLTVAHRLHTIMDSDKVVVMDAGSIVEFNHPYILLQNSNGKFYKMVEEAGNMMSNQFRRIAEDSYRRLGGYVYL